MYWIWIIIALVWIVGIGVSYDLFFKKWTDNAKWENIWYAVIWPLVGILYGIHCIHKKL